MNRPGKLPPEQQLHLGAQIEIARGNGVPWKTLERIYGRSRTQLWRCVRLMQQQTGLMKHLGDCAADTATGG